MNDHRFFGTISSFGGPKDKGVSPSENLALYEKPVFDARRLFLADQPKGTTGTARRLNPEIPYVAMRWAYTPSSVNRTIFNGDHEPIGVCLDVCTPRSWLLKNQVVVTNPKTGRSIAAWPVDWGPNGKTRRLIDASPGLLKALGVSTDDAVTVQFTL